MDSEGAGKVGSQEQKALQGLSLTLAVNAGDWEAFHFLLLFPAPVLENQLTKKETMEEGSLRWRVYHHYIQAAGGMACQLPHVRPGAPSGTGP